MLADPAPVPPDYQTLGDGLVLRPARFEDRERIADFHANTLLDINDTPPLERLRAWILDLMGGAHPSFQPGDFTLVEETATSKIVSSMALISQTWTYAGIPFKFGQPDVVSTDPAYRRRGLVRAQLDLVHRWSAERGELVQGITGIPWYYRQFGYEMALNLDGHRTLFTARVPQLAPGAAEPYLLRQATTDDLPFIQAMYHQAMSRSAIAAVRDEALWRFDLARRSEQSGMRRLFRVIERSDAAGTPVGLVIHGRKLWGTGLGILLYEVTPGTPVLAPTPGVLRELKTTGEAIATRDGGDLSALTFALGERHPLYETIPDRLSAVGRTYAWYLHVPDLPAFMRRIAPALEARLAASPQAGYTGELRVNFFRHGLGLCFDAGRLTVSDWKPDRVDAGDAAFPDLTFLQLLVGYRSLEELLFAFPDCATTTDDARALLPILFPKQDSNVWSGG